MIRMTAADVVPSLNRSPRSNGAMPLPTFVTVPKRSLAALSQARQSFMEHAGGVTGA
jgi:hypothetical protein